MRQEEKYSERYLDRQSTMENMQLLAPATIRWLLRNREVDPNTSLSFNKPGVICAICCRFVDYSPSGLLRTVLKTNKENLDDCYQVSPYFSLSSGNFLVAV